MNKEEIKARFKKAPDRLKKLVDNYPVVAASMFMLGFVLGMIAGKLFL